MHRNYRLQTKVSIICHISPLPNNMNTSKTDQINLNDIAKTYNCRLHQTKDLKTRQNQNEGR